MKQSKEKKPIIHQSHPINISFIDFLGRKLTGFPNSLTGQIISVIVFVILITAAATSIPAIWIILSKLEQETLEHLRSGQDVTQALLQAEEIRLENLALLTTQRPTLQDLLKEDNITGLLEYMQTYREGVGLDILVVRNWQDQILAISPPQLPDPRTIISPSPSYYIYPSNPQGVLLSIRYRVIENPGERLLGYITLGTFLDDGFTEQMAEVTGFEYVVTVDGRRIAASSVEENQTSVSKPRIASSHLAKGRIPIFDSQNHEIATIEVTLSIDDHIAAKQHALLTIILCTSLAITLGVGLGAVLARGVIQPVSKLTLAAQNISQGNWSTPIPVTNGSHEISTLVKAFEDSRANMHHALEVLSHSKTWLEILIQSICEGIITFDPNGTITSFSQGAERITGWKNQEVIGCPLSKVLKLSGDSEESIYHLPLQNGKCQINVLTRDQKPITLAITGAQLLSPDNDVPEMAYVFRDITEEQATHSLRAYFLANISHEFRTPLAALNASVELLLFEMGKMSFTEMSELLNSIHYSVSGLQALIDNLLESMSIEAGRFQIRRYPTMLRDVIVDAVRVMKPLLNRRQQQLIIDEPEQGFPIYIDPTRLTQVLVNLISNASKYSPIGQEIELSLRLNEEGMLRGEVADRGPGISKADRENIFKRFVRLDTNNEAHYGVGLGLSVVKAIVEEHGGEVGVDTRPDGGSIFWFTISLGEDDL